MPKVLLFKNVFYSPDKEENNWFSQATLYLASALRKAGIEVIFSSFKFSGNKGIRKRLGELEDLLTGNPGINFIGVSLCEDFFEEARELVKFLRKKTNAFIGVGCVMPTLAPRHVLAHLPQVNFLIRGSGEEVFPRLVKILEGKNADSILGRKEKLALSGLKGLAFRNKSGSVISLDTVNEPLDYDRSPLDFKLLDKSNLSEGLNLFTSRGCFNNCFFCTTPGRGRYLAKSFENLKAILGDYQKRLGQIYGRDIPSSAYKISFNDDDFLADPARAVSFFRYLKSRPFRVNFFQTGINSFFIRKDARYTGRMNSALLARISPAVFSAGKRDIYIGTENFSDAELARLGKGYDFWKAEKVIRALAARKIYQVHHFIASNNLTTPQDLLDNLLKIAGFRILYGEYFQVLTPIIPYLVSLYPSASYKIAVSQKRKKFLNIRRTLSIKKRPELDYPLVTNDIPVNEVTRQMVPVIKNLFSVEKDYIRILDMALFNLLLISEKYPAQKKEIARLIDKYKDYPEMIREKTGKRLRNGRYNLQVMITRRCHLRCRYCPVKKEEKDISAESLYRAVELLFTSSRDAVRLDFTGGEPLLRFDLVKKAVQYARKLSRVKKKAVSFYMVTNLIALTDEIADFLKKEDFFLELSVDGEERFHNLYKVGKDRRLNAYRATVLSLRSIFSRKINNYAVMVVSPPVVKYLGRNFYHLLKLGFRNIGINYALGLSWDGKERNEFFRQMDMVKSRFYPHLKNGLIRLSNLESRMEPSILNSEIMVDVNGEVHLLTDWLFETQMKIKAPALGRIGGLRSLDDIYLGRFRTLERMLKYCPSPRIKKAIFNNIDMGNAMQAYLKGWKSK
ncbi:MAG: radical SAM protein [Candidatus Omnitrophica bacterium]|nr:radical SAM protein [Candidatus Omnitrophota bacterium]MDD5654056.1 radical SAM protein [Candidatus Omnitrophota bacterium]